MLEVQEVQLQSVGLEVIKEQYAVDKDFAVAYKVCSNFSNTFHVDFSDYLLHDGLLFKGT